MMATPVYHRVKAASAAAPSGYEEELHRRIDDLIGEWLDTPAAARLCAGASYGESRPDDVERCRRWVTASYEQRYGRRGIGALPLIGVLIWPIICGIISWLVQRTLDEMFPRGGSGAIGDSDDDSPDHA